MYKFLKEHFSAKVFFIVPFILFLCTTNACVSTKITPVILHITRSSPLYVLPVLNITITDKKAVQQLYQAAYNLPVATSGKRSCTQDTGIKYHLSFSQDQSTNDEIDLEPSECLILTTSQGSLQEDYQFLNLVMKTIHVNPLIPLYSSLINK